jgi:hypothetical protein
MGGFSVFGVQRMTVCRVQIANCRCPKTETRQPLPRRTPADAGKFNLDRANAIRFQKHFVPVESTKCCVAVVHTLTVAFRSLRQGEVP